ncbi:hypothetical protein ABE485_12300 [Achromobacter spanius]|uniref:hypothetical protein n=1 Tax=Achromobacter spanius TaxID=217203 RepID=UPI0032097C61
MNKEIESVIFSNVGNRLTQELAMGLVMNLAQILHQTVQAERQAAASAAAADAVDAGAEVAGETVPSANHAAPAAIIDPAYQRKPSPKRRPRKSPAVPKAAASTKPKKARQ